VQIIVEKAILIVVASLVVRCCAITKVIVAVGIARGGQRNDVANVQFTVEKEGPLELL